MTVPVLPTMHVRAAIDADDWTRATELLAQHQHALASALAKTDLSREPLAPWRELLLEQQALQDEVRLARDQAAQALEKLGRDHRGARAWQRELS